MQSTDDSAKLQLSLLTAGLLLRRPHWSMVFSVRRSGSGLAQETVTDPFEALFF